MKLISILAVLALTGCNGRGVADRVCSITEKDPAGWIKGIEGSRQKDPKVILTSAQRKIAADDCIVNNTYDLAASGLSQGEVIQAAKTSCIQLQSQYLSASYVEYKNDMKLIPSMIEAQDRWDTDAQNQTDLLAQRAFVEARAGECWKHRVYLPKG